MYEFIYLHIPSQVLLRVSPVKWKFWAHSEGRALGFCIINITYHFVLDSINKICNNCTLKASLIRCMTATPSIPTVRRTLYYYELLANSGYTFYIVIFSCCDLDQLVVTNE